MEWSHSHQDQFGSSGAWGLVWYLAQEVSLD